MIKEINIMWWSYLNENPFITILAMSVMCVLMFIFCQLGDKEKEFSFGWYLVAAINPLALGMYFLVVLAPIEFALTMCIILVLWLVYLLVLNIQTKRGLQ